MFKASGKDTQAARVRQLLTGVNKHFLDGSVTLTVGGATYTVSQLTTLLQSFVDLRTATEAAQAAAKAKLIAETAQAPALRGVISALAAYVTERNPRSHERWPTSVSCRARRGHR